MKFHYFPCVSHKCFMPFCAFFTAFSVVMTLLILSTDLRGRRFITFEPPPIWEFESWPQDSSYLVRVIKTQYLRTPSPEPLTNRTFEPPPPEIRELFHDTKGGVFMECGADSQEGSLTEWLERTLGWRGLITQAHPSDFSEIAKSNRPYVNLAQVCISPSPYPKHAQIRESSRDGGNLTTVPCFPLYSLMQAYNTTHLDLLALTSVNGELVVLKTLPIGKIKISMIVLTNYENYVCCSEEMEDLLLRWGYRRIGSCPPTSSRCFYVCSRSTCPSIPTRV